MSATTATKASGAEADPRLLARSLAALRIFVGLIAFSNGLAKLLSFREIDVGPYLGTSSTARRRKASSPPRPAATTSR